MHSLEDVAKSLAQALDGLETNLEDRLRDLSEREEEVGSARGRAREAHAHTRRATAAIDQSIRTLRALLEESAEETASKSAETAGD